MYGYLLNILQVLVYNVSVAATSHRDADPARKKLPICSPRWRMGVACSVFERIRSEEKPSLRT